MRYEVLLHRSQPQPTTIWIRKNIRSHSFGPYWTAKDHWRYKFESEEDYVKFVLAWK